MPWWFNLTLALLGIFIFKDFYESIFLVIIAYSIYFIPEDGLISRIIFPVIVILIYFFLQFIKNNLFVYKK